MKIRSMNERGIEVFTSYIDEIKAGKAVALPSGFLANDQYSSELGGDTSALDDLNLADKYETALRLDQIVDSLGLKSAERAVGFWVWCSAYLFERLCKKDKKGIRKPGELAIWIPEPDVWKRYYRHYLAGIWRVYNGQKHLGEKLRILLTGPVNTPGELWAQAAGNQWIIANSSLLEMIYELFWDSENGKRKFGAGGESARRIPKVLRQFKRTWDFQSMTSTQILEILPAEFDRFRS